MRNGQFRAAIPTEPQSADRRTSLVRWRTTLPLLVLLAIAVHAILPQLATLESTAAELRQMRWWAVGLAAIAQAVSLGAYGYTVQSVARLTRDRIGGFTAVRVALAATSVGLVSGGPLGFGAATHRWLRDRGVSADGAALCASVPGLLNIAVLVAFTMIGLTYLVAHHILGHSQRVTLAALGVVVAGLVLLTTWLLSSPERTTRLVMAVRHGLRRVRRNKVTDAPGVDLRGRIGFIHESLRNGAWHRPILGATSKLAFDAVTLFLLFVGTGHVIHPLPLLAGYALPQLVGTISFVPGGLGIVEGGMTGLYIAIHVPTATAVLVVLAYRGLSFWAPLLLGIPLAVGLERSRRARASRCDTC